MSAAPPFRAFVLALALTLGSAAAFAADRPLAIDLAQSRIAVAVTATVDSFTGRLERFAPGVAVDDAGQVTTATVDFHFRDFLTGKPKRDAAMHEWQQTATHPDARFELTSLTPKPAVPAAFTARGRFTFHGVTRELSFPVTITRTADDYLIDGDASIDTREFGLPIIRMLGLLKVDPLVHVRFHLQARLAP